MIAIECLGFQIRTLHSISTWKGYKELQQAEKYAGLLSKDLRSHLALNTFCRALQKRDRERKVKK